MSDMVIRSDKKWRNFKYRDEVPARTLKSTFDYLTEEDMDGYFKYRRRWYHLSEFERTSIPGWDGAHGESYFSAILIKVSRDGEQYKVGLAMS